MTLITRRDLVIMYLKKCGEESRRLGLKLQNGEEFRVLGYGLDGEDCILYKPQKAVK